MDIRTFLWATALRTVFFGETSHCAYAKVKALLGDRKNYRALSSLLKAYLGGFA
jgi:hypothetical protein